MEETLKKTRERSDLRVYGKANKLVLAGEVKLPGTFEGRDPYHNALVEDAYQKADQAEAQFFFTWNVKNSFCLIGVFGTGRFTRNASRNTASISIYRRPMMSRDPVSRQEFKHS